MNLEIDASGAFIYNGIKLLDAVQYFSHPIDIFEILYNLSVGFERLMKVAIVLIEHNNEDSIEEFEQSLISHNTLELLERIHKHKPLNLSDIHREFLALLSKFYKSHRYERYSLSSIPNIDSEKTTFLSFLKKHLNLDIKIEEEFFSVTNTDQIRKFIGRLVKKIAVTVFEVVKERARELNVYPHELRAESKGLKVFYGENLDFIQEKQIKKEIILYLIDKKNAAEHLELLRSFGSLELDPGMTPNYIRALLYDSELPFVEEIVEDAFSQLSNIPERLSMHEVVDSDVMSFDLEEDS